MWLSHSTPWVSGSSAANLTPSSAFSFPEALLCVGHHRISMMISGRAFRSTAMCFLAWSAYFRPGPGSSQAIWMMAAYTSVKIGSHSGVICLLEPGKSRTFRAFSRHAIQNYPCAAPSRTFQALIVRHWWWRRRTVTHCSRPDDFTCRNGDTYYILLAPAAVLSNHGD